jgi:hypothetical protein
MLTNTNILRYSVSITSYIIWLLMSYDYIQTSETFIYVFMGFNIGMAILYTKDDFIEANKFDTNEDYAEYLLNNLSFQEIGILLVNSMIKITTFIVAINLELYMYFEYFIYIGIIFSIMVYNRIKIKL